MSWNSVKTRHISCPSDLVNAYRNVPRLVRNVRSDQVVEPFVGGTGGCIKGTAVYDPVDAVLHGRRHHVVATAGAYVERQLAVRSQHRQVDDCVHPLSGRYDLIDISCVDLEVFVRRVEIVDVGQTKLMPSLQRLDDVRTEHTVSAQDEYLHGRFILAFWERSRD